jgi:putative membrane protein insertion efficiency factor
VPPAEAHAAPAAPVPVPRRGWRRLVPRRPWRWLGGIAALAALGSLAVGVLVVWLTRRPGHGATTPSGTGHSSGVDPSSGSGPTPSGTPWTPGTGGHPTGADPTGVGGGATGGPTGTDNAGCTVEGINCDPAGKACDSACNSVGSDCNRQLDDACAGPSCGSSDGCSGSDPNCSGGDHAGTGHMLLTSLLGSGLPSLHRTATVPAGTAVSRTATAPTTAPDAGWVSPVAAGSNGAGRAGVPARAGIAAIRAYQRISPRLPTRCRYTPTCSRYGLAAIERYGLLTGARLAVLRIHRCTADVGPGTADPLPA